MFVVGKQNLSSHFRSTKKKPSNIPKTYQLAAQLFDEKITLHLKTLDLPPNSSNISLSWLSAAVSFISTVHHEAEIQISNLKSDSNDYPYYHDLYMDYSLKVLDLCNLISSAAHRLTEQRLLMNFSLRLLKFSDQMPPVEKLKKSKDALTRSVSNRDESTKEKGYCAKTLIDELSVLIGNLPLGDDLVRRMFYATGVLTVFVGSVLVNVLYGETTDAVELRVPNEFGWADSVNRIQAKVFDLIKSKENVLLEVVDVTSKAVVIRNLIDDVLNGGDNGDVRVRLEEGVEEMTIGAKRFSDGIDALTNGVNGMFRTVLKIRSGRLDM